MIVYNSNFSSDGDGDGVQDSLEVANYYALKRGVPSSNILGVAAEDATRISAFANYQSEIVQPINSKLALLGATNIDVILLVYGMPWMLGTTSLDSALAGLNFYAGGTWPIVNPYKDQNPGFHAEAGSFTHAYQLRGTTMYLISRLDGPRGVQGTLDLIDQALYADRYVYNQAGYLTGNVYVNSQNRKSATPYTDAFLTADPDVQLGGDDSYESADVNIAYAEHYAINAGLPLKWEQNGILIGTPTATYQDGSSALTAPNALYYSGWYAYNQYFDAFRWLPGAVGTDLNSSSLGYTLRSPYVIAWGVQALNHGVSGTCGVVDEPGVAGHPYPNVPLYYLLKGYTFAEASALSLPYMGWVNLCIGDPLYRPFGPKTPMLDTSTPQFVAGYPKFYQSVAAGNLVSAMVDDSAGPEVAIFRLDYGTTISYGQSMTSNMYVRRFSFSPPELKSNTLYHYRVTITDPVGHSTSSSDMTFTTPTETPYTGGPYPIPGIISFGNFDNGGNGVGYHTRDSYGSGGYFRPDTAVNFSAGTILASPTEWYNYAVNIAAAGQYSFQFNVSDYYGTGGVFHISIDGTDVTGPITVPNTGGTGVFTISGINLPAGLHTLRVTMDVASPNNGQYGLVAEFDKMTIQ